MNLKIKSLAEDDRPREKLLSLGRHTLSDAELLAIILASGNKDESAVQLARRILADHKNDINELAKLSVNDLKKYKGVGMVKAINVAAAFELGRRRNDFDKTEKVKIIASVTAYQLLQKRLSDLPHEEVWILHLNRANQVIREENMSKGGISGTVIDNRLICKSALENKSVSIILAHNHPSGEIVPSQEDKEVTKKLKEALKLFDITLADHLIIGDKKYFSFADGNLL
ncbi:MAG: DNA repair protein RadC [Bacteroidetes bacterium]|nr:DNA repair protein RadC [Bacteroidota bacterium]